MLAHLCASEVHDVAWSTAELLVEKSRCVPVRNKADVVAVRLLRDGQAAISGFGAYVGLAGGTERKV
jgi:hypothetical protein